MRRWSSSVPRRVSLRIGLVAAALTLVLDQLSKCWILESVMDPPRLIAVAPFFNIVLVWNRGVSFGLFGGEAPWLLLAVAAAIIVVLLVWLTRARRRPLALALGLVIGGALGNAADRMVHGAVMDFLDFHAGGIHWPAFNIADSAITIGVALMLLDGLFERRG
jgi:signal peptidase II